MKRTRVKFRMWSGDSEEETVYSIDYADQEDLDVQLSRIEERLQALYDAVEYLGVI